MVLASTVSTIEGIIPYFILTGVVLFIIARLVAQYWDARNRNRGQ